MKRVRIYIEYAKNAFKERFAFRTNYLFRIGGRLLFLFAQVYIWRALMGANGQVSTSVGTVTLQDMVTYIIVSTTVATLIGNNVIDVIDARVRSGEIAMYLIRPMNFRNMLFSSTMGANLFNFLFILLPVLIFGVIAFGFMTPSPANAALFILALINGIVISFFINYAIGLLGFLYMSIWHFRRFIGDLMSLFSGSLIPLWFFPGWLAKVSEFLPFPMTFYIPIQILLGKSDVLDCMLLIGRQLLWIVVLYGVAKLLWQGSVKRLVIQGG